MAVGAMALLALACGAVFVGAAPPKGEVLTEAAPAAEEAEETPLEHLEHIRGTGASTRQ